MSEQQLDSLSNKEIADLYRRTVAEAQKQHNLDVARTNSQADFDSQLGLDKFGNIAERTTPKKPVREVIDPSGYVRELADGETLPKSSGYAIIDWLNRQNVEDDPELKETLGDLYELNTFSVSLGHSDWNMAGRLDKKGWFVTAQHADRPSFRFILNRDLTRDQAVSQASRYIRSKNPELSELSDEQLRMVALKAANATTADGVGDAAIKYIRYAIPSDQIEELDAEFFTRADRQDLITKAVFFAWRNSSLAKGFVASEEALAYLDRYIASRDFCTVRTISEAWQAYKEQQSAYPAHETDTEPESTKEEFVAGFEYLSDETVEKLLTESKLMRARQRGV